MSSLWFLVATTAAFCEIRRLADEAAPWGEIAEQLDLWVDCLFELSPDVWGTGTGLALAALGILERAQVRH